MIFDYSHPTILVHIQILFQLSCQLSLQLVIEVLSLNRAPRNWVLLHQIRHLRLALKKITTGGAQE